MSKTRGKRLLAVVLSVLMIMTLLPTGMFAEDSYTYSYTFNDVTLGGYGYDSVLDEDSGAVTLTYSGQYQELQFALPSELNANSLLSISFDVASGETSDLAVKVIATDNSNDIVGWGSSSKALTDDEITTVSAAESVTIGLMYGGTGTDVEYVITGFTVIVSEEAATSGDSGDTGSSADSGEYDFSDYTLAASTSFSGFTAGNWVVDYSFDMAVIEALETEGSLLVITRDSYDAEAGYDKFLLIDAWWQMRDFTTLALGTSISKAADGEADIDCLFDNGTTVVYDGATVYAALLALDLNTSSGADMLLISNSGSTSYNITSVSAYIPTSAVDDPGEVGDTAIWTITRDEWAGYAGFEFVLSDYCDNADEIVWGDNVTINVTVESDGTYFNGTIGVVVPDDTSEEGSTWAAAGTLETTTYTDVWTFTTDVAYDYAQVQVWWMNEDCTYFSITDISVTVTSTDDVLAANQELIATLSELLKTDEVMYVDQLGSNDDYSWEDYFFAVYYGEVHPNWDEIVANWTSSLGDEANIGLSATVYQAPVAGTKDDPDGTDGLLTMSYIASVGSEEDGTYVESDFYYVDVIIKATQLYSVTVPTDLTGATVSTDKTYANEGDEVTITIDLEEGYSIDFFGVYKVVYEENGSSYWYWTDYTDNGDGTYTFVMPDGNVQLDVGVGSLSISYDYNDEYGYVSGTSYSNEGDTVSVSVYAKRGYELSGEVTAVDENGDSVALELQSWTYTLDFGDGPMTVYTYYYTMPDSAVTVTVPFAEIENFTNNIIIINDNGNNSYIEDVDFTDEDTYLELTYTLNDEDKGDWEFGAVYSCSWNYMFNLSSYNESHGTYAISLADLAALVAEYGYDANNGIMIQLWDDGNDDYITINSAALVTGYYNVNVVDNDGITWVEIGGVRKEGGTVSVDVDVAEGYIIKSVSAVDANGNEVELNPDYMGYWDANYTFIMPDADVTITFETVAQSELTTIVTESDDGGIWVSTEYGSPIFYSQYVDFTDENLYITINYEVLSSEYDGYTVAVVSYGDENYDGSHNYDADSTLYQDVLRIMDNGTGTVSVALTDIQAAVDASGIAGGNYYLWAYTGEFKVTSVSVETLDTYTPAESSVGEIVTISGVEYEIVWDTTTPNPTGNWYSVNNIVGWSTSTYTDWWTIYDSFKNSVVSHLDDSSLIQVVTDETIDYDLGVWLQLNVGDYHILYAGMNYVDNTAYIRLDEVAAVAEDEGYEITTDTINSLIAGDFYLNDTVTAGITAVRILTPHEYVEDSWTWAEDYSSATLTLVCTEGTHTVDVEAFVGSDTTDATCTEDGKIVYNAAATYDGVVYTTSETVVIPATGHSYEATVTDPTCEEKGYTTYTCSVCGDSYVDDYVEATGHDWSVSYEWSEDGKTCTATHVCANDATHNVTVDATVTSEVTVDPTCEEMGTTTYTATFDVDWAETQTKDVVDVEATGHDWSVSYEWSEDGKTCTATHVCANDATHNVTVDATVTSEVTIDPTCEEMGTTTYTATFGVDWAETQTKDVVDVEATGHDWSVSYEWSEDGKTCTATHVCANDATHNVTVDATVTSEVTVDPTCEEMGTTTYTATFYADWAETQTKDVVDVEATGHDWSVSYEWSEDGKTCTATRTCANDETHVETADATISSTIKIAATCEEMGTTTYTATFGVDWAETQTTDVVDIEALGHTSGEPVEENRVESTCTVDGSYESAVYCIVCNAEISRETVTIPATGHTPGEEVTENNVAPTCTVDGSYDIVTYCTVCGEETSRTTVTVPATGHTNGEAVKENVINHTDTTDGSYDVVVYCTVCGEEVSRETVTVPAGHDWDEGVVTAEPTCEAEGVKTYTCSVCGDTYTEPIAATGHTQGEAVQENYVAPTATTDGSYDLVIYCTVCGEEISRQTISVPATGEPDLSNLRADYTAVKEAIAKAEALNPADYTNFSEVTNAINSVIWTYSVTQQSAVGQMATNIENAIARLIPANTVSEEVTIIDPIESTDTDTEEETEPEAEPEVSETNPTTGIALSLLPMAIAAFATVSSKRR